jgi:urease accessory protein
MGQDADTIMGMTMVTITVITMGMATRTAIRTAIRMTTTTEHGALLHLLWLASPALPVGAFSYSEGLEAAVEAGTVRDEASAAQWLLNQLALTQARAELPLVARAHAAALRLDAAALQACNDWVLQTRETSESLQQTQQMGRSLLAWLRGLVADHPLLPLCQQLSPAPTWPVILACAIAVRGAPLEPALHAAAFGWAENLMQAAVRCVPLGQSAGQRLLAQLVQAIPGAVQTALAADEPIAFAPMLGVLGARHETQYSRLFRS